MFGPPADVLRFAPADRLTLELCGPFAGALAGEPDNLVLRAARRLAGHAGRPAAARIRLEKNLPVAAGLGGGSGDAAATLRGLNRLWRLGLAEGDLMPLARDLGADVPVCLAARPARMRGIGERLEWLDGLPPLALLLVNPNRPLATAAVFRGWARCRRRSRSKARRRGSRRRCSPGCGRAPIIWRRPPAGWSRRSMRCSRRWRRSPAASSRACPGAAPPASVCSRIGPRSEAAADRIGRARPKWWVACSLVAPS